MVLNRTPAEHEYANSSGSNLIILHVMHAFRACVCAVSKHLQRVSPEHHPPVFGWLSIAVSHLLLVSAVLHSWP